MAPSPVLAKGVSPPMLGKVPGTASGVEGMLDLLPAPGLVAVLLPRRAGLETIVAMMQAVATAAAATAMGRTLRRGGGPWLWDELTGVGAGWVAEGSFTVG